MADDVVGELGTLSKCSAVHLAFEVALYNFKQSIGQQHDPVFNHERDCLAPVGSVKDNSAGCTRAVVEPSPVAIVIADHPDLILPWAESRDN